MISLFLLILFIRFFFFCVFLNLYLFFCFLLSGIIFIFSLFYFCFDFFVGITIDGINVFFSILKIELEHLLYYIF